MRSDNLAESEEKFKSIYDNALDGILLADIETHKFLMGNRMMCRMLGFDEEELKNINIKDIHPEKDLPYIMEQFEKHVKGEIDVVSEIPVKRKDGSIFYADIKSSHLIIRGKKCIVGVFRDTTERRKAQEALRKSEELLRLMAENIREIFWIALPDFARIEYINPAFEDIWGRKTSELYQDTTLWLDAILPEDRDMVLSAQERLAQGEPYRIQFRISRPDGTVRWVEDRGYPVKDSSGRMIHAVGAVQDITDKIHMEEERKRLANIVEKSTDFVSIADYDGRLQYINQAGRKMLGIPLNEDISSLYIPYLFTESANDVLLNESVPTGIRSGVWMGELVMRSSEGKEIPILQTLIVNQTSDGTINFFFTIARDITDRKRTAQEVLLARDEALRASAVKSEFLSKMSHELRTPLVSIMGFSSLLMNKQAGELNEKQEHYIDIINSSGTHLLGMINNILDLVRVESCEKIFFSLELIPVPELIDEILNFVNENASKKKITIKKEIEPGLGFIKADKIRFKQILNSLLDNAIKFSKPDGGTVTIAARKDGDMAQFSISDTGIGIKEEHMDKLFDLFHQIDSGLSRKYGGSGIGLAITKQLVEQQGGRIWAQSKFGEGSTFMFTLPLEEKKIK